MAVASGMEDARVESVLKAMAAEDRHRGDHARAVIEWLAGGEDIGGVDLAGVLRFAWYEIPVEWAGPPDMHVAVTWPLAWGRWPWAPR